MVGGVLFVTSVSQQMSHVLLCDLFAPRKMHVTLFWVLVVVSSSIVGSCLVLSSSSLSMFVDVSLNLSVRLRVYLCRSLSVCLSLRIICIQSWSQNHFSCFECTRPKWRLFSWVRHIPKNKFEDAQLLS